LSILGFGASVFFTSDKVCKGFAEGIFGISGWLFWFGAAVGFDWNWSVRIARKISFFRILWDNIFFSGMNFIIESQNANFVGISAKKY
jgi:hypothetical protein